MRVFAAVLVIATAAIGSTFALSVAPRTLVPLNHAYFPLLSRQVAGPCNATCTPAQDKNDACNEDATCLCTPSLASKLLSCASCEIQIDPRLRSALETSWNQYTSSCASIGRPVHGDINSAYTATPSDIPTPTTNPSLGFTPTPASVSPVAASSSGSSSDNRGLLPQPNSATTFRVGPALGIFAVGVIAALL
ncbi:hypothetical protein FRC01_005594 [Tulasnella sp. 417]|nr:hypothetical protein FRC01_005594 [Tulasnella sp. 417]